VANKIKLLRTGVIGLGVGEQHVKTYQAIDGCEVKAICDFDTDHMNRVGNDYGINERYDDYRRITEHPDIDIVSICTFDNYHAEQAISSLNNGKHIMVEKPVALNRHDAERILRAQQDNNRHIISNFILRKSPRFEEVRQQVQSGEFGEIFHIEGDYLHHILHKVTEGWRGGMEFYCVAYGGGIHLIDLMRWIMGQEVIEVCSMGNNLLSRGSQFKFEDCLTSLFKFEGGATGKTTTAFGLQRTKFHALNVYGERKSFVNDMPDAKLFDGDQPENVHSVTTPYQSMKKGDHLPDFVQAIRTGNEPGVTVQDVFRVMDICFAAWEALQKQSTIKITYSI